MYYPVFCIDQPCSKDGTPLSLLATPCGRLVVVNKAKAKSQKPVEADYLSASCV